MTSVPKHIAEIISRFMNNKMTPQESDVLTEWMEASDENETMFELLTEERNTNWAKAWFKEMGVRNRHIEKKKYTGWYEPPSEPLPVPLVLLAILGGLLLIALIILFQVYPELIREFFSHIHF